MDPVQKKVTGFARSHKMFSPASRVLAAVSGGPDSVALVRMLAAMSHADGFFLAVVHVNHALRGVESRGDESFVIDLCRELNLPVFVCDGRLLDGEVPEGGSYEEAARNVRRELFVQTAEECGADTVALGHHMNDLAETFLMRLMRGSGIGGLASIVPVNGFEGLRLVRPLLCLERSEIEDWLRSNNFQFRTDESNTDTNFTRNRVRHALVPEIKREFNPGIISILSDTAEQMRMLDDWVRPQVDKKFRSCVRPCFRGRAAVVDMKKFALEHDYVRYAVVKKICELIRGEYSTVDFAHVRRVCDLLSGSAGSGQKGELPGISFYIEQNTAVFWNSVSRSAAFKELVFDVDRPGRYRSKGLVVEVEELGSGQRPEECFKSNPEGWNLTNFGRRIDFYAALDVDALKGGLVLRPAQPGESICPTGMNGSRVSIKNVLGTMNVPAPLRSGFPVLSGGDGIVWVPGYRIAGFAGLGPSTRRAIKIRLGLHMPLWLC